MAFSLSISSYSQQIISGKIKDSASNPISNANVSFKTVGGTSILGYTITDNTGEFELKMASEIDSIILNISHISFQSLIKNINTKNYKTVFYLKKQIDALEEIVVKSPPPIYKKRDTINYNVSAFSDNNDKAIRDVIEKLPGIEMDGDRILYNGRPIQKFYINGLDMLEGKYSLANENLPAEAVKSVQVIENDQPIKILDSLVFSDRASLNLKLKKEITVTGTTRVGIGGSPLSWDVNTTPMLFRKNIQGIGSYQANNIGKGIEKQLEDLTIEDYETNERKEFVKLVGVMPPPIESKRWIFNNINFSSTNFIKKFDNDLEIRGGVSYLNNNTDQSSYSEKRIFTGENEIRLNEEINTFQNQNNIKGSFTLHTNKKRLYFENKISFEHAANQGKESIVANNSDIFQNKIDKYSSIKNDLDLKTFVGKKLIQFNSSSHILTTPQALNVSYSDTTSAIQNTELNDWRTKNSASFIERVSNFTIIPEVGFLLEKKTLNSRLQEQNGNEFDNNRNEISKISTIPYLSLGTQFNTKNLNIELNLPFRMTSIKLLDDDELNNKIDKLLIFPDVKLKYDLNSKWSVRIGSGFSQVFSEIDQLYSSPILVNYRNIQRFPLNLMGTKILDSYLSSSFKNPLKGTFIDFSLSNLERFRDFTPSYTINENGFYRFNLIDVPSQQSSFKFNSNLGKFLRKSKTVLKLKNSVSFDSSSEKLDSQENNIENYTYSAGLQVNNTLLEWLVVDFENRFLYSKKYIDGDERTSYSLQEYNFDLSIMPYENHLVSFNQNYTINQFQNSSKSYFADLEYQIQVPEWNIELELGLQNIFNEKEYISLFNTDFSVVENITRLRPRLFFVGLDFKF